MGIFRAYDIRGIYGKDLTEEIALKIGAAFGTMNNGTIAVGYDARLSSPSIRKALVEGLLSTGCSVMDVGLITSPMMIFTVGHYRYDGGIMVTASHNPKEYNGFKVFVKNAMPVSYESGLNSLEALVSAGGFRKGTGKLSMKSIEEDYERFILSNAKPSAKGLRIVVDGGNGAAGRLYSDILRKTGAQVIEIFSEPDGNFPNHVPDPTKPENITAISERVLKEKADLGFAFDGDGDRLVVIDADGTAVDSGLLFVILAKHALAKNRGGKIIINIATSMAVEDMVRKYGGIAVPCKVGHTYITQKMVEEGGVFAGELSGHYFFKETFSGDDALLACLKLLEYLSCVTRIGDERNNMPKYFSEIAEDIAIPVAEEKKAQFMNRIKMVCIKRGLEMDETDGIKIMFDDGWALFRPSNTTPLIRYGFEARNEEEFGKIKKVVEEIRRLEA